MTEKLYYTDSHIKEFAAVVLECERAEHGYRVVLNRTAFFPEGGGQYADTGCLMTESGSGIQVLDAQEKAGIVYHYTDGPVNVGENVKGQIDWEKRFESMQQHTGEHIISGLVHERFGYRNVGFHLGADYCTMDFDGPITKKELREIELAANRVVYRNLDIEVLYPSAEALKNMEYRSKIEIDGQVRIVNIPGVDTCACCAPHVKKTGEIGNVKLVNMMNYKGGERIYMLCGFRALADHEAKEKNAKAISALLCVKESEIAEAVTHLREEQTAWKEKALALKRQLLKYRAEEIDISQDITTVFANDLEGNEPREFMNQLLAQGAKVCAVFAAAGEGGYRYVIGSRTEDVRPLCKKLNAAFEGRGGGKPEMVQGSLTGAEDAIRKLCTL